MEEQYYELTDALIQDGYLRTKEIIDSFERINRVDFVPVEQRLNAYRNAPLSIGFDQTISQPLIVASMIELLQPKAGEKILEVGSGSGWQTAILADLVSGGAMADGDAPRGSVTAIERIPELKAMTEQHLAVYGFVEQGIVSVVLGDGTKGYRNNAPYDRIIASASSAGDVPVAWKRQLKIGGRIVAPVGNSIVVIDKISKNKYTKKEHFGYSLSPLVV